MQRNKILYLKTLPRWKHYDLRSRKEVKPTTSFKILLPPSSAFEIAVVHNR